MAASVTRSATDRGRRFLRSELPYANPLGSRRQATHFSRTTEVTLKQVRSPLFWPSRIKSAFRMAGYPKDTPKGWYRWGFDRGCQYNLLWLPDERAAIIESGATDGGVWVNTVSPANSPEAALRTLLG